LAAVASNRFRTILALLGITIGVGAVIAIVGLGDGAKLVVRDSISRFGAGSLMVQPNYQAIEASDGRYDSPSVTREDIAQINAQADAVRAVTPQANWTGMSARRLGRTREVEIYGTLHHYLAANSSMRLARGRFLHPEDDRLQRKVAVLGSQVAAELFPNESPLGALISIGTWFELEVVGVLAPEEQGLLGVTSFAGSVDDRVFVPVSTLQRLTGWLGIFFLWGQAASLREIDAAKQQILAILDANHGRHDGRHRKFVVEDMNQLLETIDATTGTITTLVSLLGVIALVVAGIGVMNIMLVSVRERTREIGTRKAIGAQQASILNQFVAEAVLICGGGGLAGIGLAAVAITVVAQATQWPGLISLATVRLAFLLAFGTGLASGLYPASRAARMDPVDALRHE
jgi:putative ABC transport system permease protein